MSEYIVKIGFWLRAYDGFTVEAKSDADAIEQAKAAAKTAMESGAYGSRIPRATSESRGGARRRLQREESERSAGTGLS